VISLDTTRRDRVGFFSDLDATPNLDAAFRTAWSRGPSVVLELDRPFDVLRAIGKLPLDDAG
jgi:hypothetical protein